MTSEKRVKKTSNCPTGYRRVYRADGEKTGTCRKSTPTASKTSSHKSKKNDKCVHTYRRATFNGPNGEIVVTRGKDCRSCPSGYTQYVTKDGKKSSKYCQQHDRLDRFKVQYGPQMGAQMGAQMGPQMGAPAAPPVQQLQHAWAGAGGSGVGGVKIEANPIARLRSVKDELGAGGLGAGNVKIEANPMARLRRVKQEKVKQELGMPALEKPKRPVNMSRAKWEKMTKLAMAKGDERQLAQMQDMATDAENLNALMASIPVTKRR